MISWRTLRPAPDAEDQCVCYIRELPGGRSEMMMLADHIVRKLGFIPAPHIAKVIVEMQDHASRMQM